MAFIKYNPNPQDNYVGDCVIRAISKVLNQSWEDTYIQLALQGYMLADMPSANHVWGAYLKGKNYERHSIPNTCPVCYTIKDFCEDHPIGTFILATGTHVVAVQDGNYYDAWDSGNEIPIYFWQKKED